jgi:hypothetical protein
MRGVSSDSLASLAKAIGLHRPHWGVLLTAGTLSKHDGPPCKGRPVTSARTESQSPSPLRPRPWPDEIFRMGNPA